MLPYRKEEPSQLRRRWGLIKSYIGWEDYLGFAILLFGVLGLFNGPIPFIPGLTNAYRRITPELIGIGITVLIIDNANEAIKRREEKKRLILQMGSPDNAFAREAVRQMRARGWLTDGSLQGASFTGTNLKKANLVYANLREVSLWGANLKGAFLMNAELQGADLISANLRKADLRWSNLEKAALMGADLQGANLEKVNLEGAGLIYAELQEAKLMEANLQGANLYAANLQNANLNNANLRGANLWGTNLEGANVTRDQITKAGFLEQAIMPDGSVIEDIRG